MPEKAGVGGDVRNSGHGFPARTVYPVDRLGGNGKEGGRVPTAISTFSIPRSTRPGLWGDRDRSSAAVRGREGGLCAANPGRDSGGWAPRLCRQRIPPG